MDKSLADFIYLQELKGTMPWRDWYYGHYLQSEHWQNLREKKFSEVGRKCEVCGTEEHLRVHHLKYRNVIDCTTADLQVLCDKHHRKAHDMTPKKALISKLKQKLDRIRRDFNKTVREIIKLEDTEKVKVKIKMLPKKPLTDERKYTKIAKKRHSELDAAFDSMFK